MNVNFNESGLVPAIVQDWKRGDVLMLGHMNRAALERTVSTGLVTFYSRSRQQLWTKGETSGNRLRLRRMRTDCDADALLVEVEVEGQEAVCHEGYRSCFFREWRDGDFVETGERVFDPTEVYSKR
jgi:phosphoribosyl-AMP cyclohydrolase